MGLRGLAPDDGLRDALGRPLRDLRISVTDRCNFRCTYCMPAEQFGERYEFLPRSEILRFEEIERIARLALECGAEKLRITGGEPLLRAELPSLVQRLAALPGGADLALTTNGVLLPDLAPALARAGLRRISVSLDSLIALGSWQVQRLQWKEALIARVEARVHAEPQPAPGRSDWGAINAGDHEYLHVRAAGTFLHDDETRVYASTVLGPGYWIITPLKAEDGTVVLVNRGFVPTDRREVSTRKSGNPDGPMTVTGLLLISTS